MRTILLCAWALVLNAQTVAAQTANGKAWIPITSHIRDVSLPQLPKVPQVQFGYRPHWPPPTVNPDGSLADDSLWQQEQHLRTLRDSVHKQPSQAQSQNEPVDKFMAGRNYWRGINGSPRNIGVAVEFLRQSVEADFPPALYQLGRLYQTGRGVDQNQKKGDDLIKKAWRLGLSTYDASLIDNEQVY